jgi:enoyl-CoA hydratase/carnithine racemase
MAPRLTDEDPLLVIRDGGVVIAQLNRPHVHNALSARLVDAFADLVTSLCSTTADPESQTRCLVLTGSRPSFCSGIDVREPAWHEPAARMRRRGAFRDLIGSLHRVPFPTIAAVEGHVLGAGLEVALACDIVVAGETATFGLPELSVGAVPGGGGVHALVQRAGRGLAAHLLLAGRRVDASRMAQIGAIEEVVPTGQAGARAIAIGAGFAESDPEVLRGCVNLLRNAAHLSRPDALAVEDGYWWAGVGTRVSR